MMLHQGTVGVFDAEMGFNVVLKMFHAPRMLQPSCRGKYEHRSQITSIYKNESEIKEIKSKC